MLTQLYKIVHLITMYVCNLIKIVKVLVSFLSFFYFFFIKLFHLLVFYPILSQPFQVYLNMSCDLTEGKELQLFFFCISLSWLVTFFTFPSVAFLITVIIVAFCRKWQQLTFLINVESHGNVQLSVTFSHKSLHLEDNGKNVWI